MTFTRFSLSLQIVCTVLCTKEGVERKVVEKIIFQTLWGLAQDKWLLNHHMATPLNNQQFHSTKLNSRQEMNESGSEVVIHFFFPLKIWITFSKSIYRVLCWWQQRNLLKETITVRVLTGLSLLSKASVNQSVRDINLSSYVSVSEYVNIQIILDTGSICQQSSVTRQY